MCPFGSPLFGFFWFVPGFVEANEVVKRILRMGVSVTELEAAAFEDFEKEWFCFSLITFTT